MTQKWQWASLWIPLFMVALVAPSSATAQNLIFSDGLDNNTNWTNHGTSENFDDWIATYGYDYSADSISAAPGGSDTIGLKMEANLFSELPNEITAVHSDAAFTGQYAVQVDVWMNWMAFDPEPTPTTEFGGIGVGHDGATEGRNGASFIFTGDGGSSRDYRLYKNQERQDNDDADPAIGAQYDVTTMNANFPVDSEFFAAFPYPTPDDLAAWVPGQVTAGLNGPDPLIAARDGAAGFRWMTVTAQVDTAGVISGISPGTPGTTAFYIENEELDVRIKIGTVDNTNGGTAVGMGGAVSLSYADLFSSLAENPEFQFGLFDNVRVWDAWVIEGFLEADFNEDGSVNGDDFLLWQGGFGTQADATKMDGDSDGDGDVDGDDFLKWQQQFGSGDGAASSAVPEPTSVLLLLASALGLLACRRTR